MRQEKNMFWKIKRKTQAFVAWWKFLLSFEGSPFILTDIRKWLLMHSDKMSNLPNYVHLDRLRMKILFVWLCPEENLNEAHFVMPDSTNRLQLPSEQKPWHVNKCANDGQATLRFLSLACSETVSHIRPINNE